MLYCGYDMISRESRESCLTMFLRVALLALRQSYDWSNSSEVVLFWIDDVDQRVATWSQEHITKRKTIFHYIS